jgi:hypothetical protein
MSNDHNPQDHSVSDTAGDSLQFERAEFASPSAFSCAFCKTPAAGEYYQINGKTACGRCRAQIDLALTGGSPPARMIRALGAGLAAAVAGFLVVWGFQTATGAQWALISILVGWMVGVAVRWGARARGGWFYQLIGVVLTYFAIASTYTPEILSEIRSRRADVSATVQPATPANTSDSTTADAAQPAPTKRTPKPKQVPFVFDLALAFAISLAAPFLAGFGNILGLIIIAVGLLQPWRLNKRVPIQITGPFNAGGAQFST